MHSSRRGSASDGPLREQSARPSAAARRWREVVAALPRKQTRVFTWPVVTVFGFIALPDEHIFLKPNVTRADAREYDFDFLYRSQPNWETYSSRAPLGFASAPIGEYNTARDWTRARAAHYK
jgi:hypothetical protein